MSKWKKIGVVAAIAVTCGLLGAGVSTAANLSGKLSTTTSSESSSDSSDSTTTANDLTKTNSDSGSVTNASKEIGSTSDANSSDSTDSDGDLSVEDVAANSMPAMVAITNTSVSEVQNYLGNGSFSNGGQTAESVSMGTGIIVGETDDLVLIATNAHVISGADQLSIAFVDDSAASGTVVGSDTTNDLAVVSVKKSDLSSDTLSQIKVITMGSSDDLKVGEQVVAIGNALGYGQSVSTGIVSALNRSITSQDESTGETTTSEGMIQTDASINPGNSGGALLNMKGELIGINSAKYEDTSVEGMGYAIPISYAEPILTKLANGESTSSDSTTTSGSGDAYLGIQGTSVTETYSQYYGIPEGVYVSVVASGSAAEQAGIEQGDIITAVDNTSITSTEDLKTALSNYSSGDTATITLSRSASNIQGYGGSGNSYVSGTVTVTFGSTSSAGSTSTSKTAA